MLTAPPEKSKKNPIERKASTLEAAAATRSARCRDAQKLRTACSVSGTGLRVLRRPAGSSPRPLASQTASLQPAARPRSRGGGAERGSRSVLPAHKTPIPTSRAAPDRTGCSIGLPRFCILTQIRPRSTACSWQGRPLKNRSRRGPPQPCDAAGTRLRSAPTSQPARTASGPHKSQRECRAPAGGVAVLTDLPWYRLHEAA